MKKFKHASPDSLEKAVSILDKYGRKARVIAGGTDLLGEMQDTILPDYPEVIVNLKTISGLDYIREEHGVLHIGALTRLEDIATNEVILANYPLLAEASCRTASPHIREMGTIAGNICQSNRCWYYWVADNRFDCLRKGGATCFAVNGDARYHSIFGSTRVDRTPCSVECPAGIDIPDYMARIRANDIAGAARILVDSNPLPAITGRVCPHYCQTKCNRVGYDESVSVRNVERYLGDYILEHPGIISEKKPASGKKAAVIGSGPAGLAAAFCLNKLGHAVTVYEKMPKAGGFLTYGIPPYRLPKEVVDRQIAVLEQAGIKFMLNANVDVGQLSRDYDAVFLACGTWKDRRSGIPGEEHLLSGLDFLKDVNTGKRAVPGQKVAVIGGGNVAVDVARTLLRLGAEPVILYRRTLQEMPALAEEIEKLVEENIEVRFLTLPVSASKKDGKVLLTCTKMQLGAPDESGRPRPEPVPGSEFILEFDAVMEALGEEADLSMITGQYLDAGRLKIDEHGQLGGNVFAGGDFVTGASTVVQAIASGRKAACNIEAFLGGEQEPAEQKPAWLEPDTFDCGSLIKTTGVTAPELPAGQRSSLDAEDVSGLPLEAVAAEANRCFNCGCVAVNPSDLAPALIVLEAQIKTTKRVIQAAEFYTVNGEKTTILDDDEIVIEIIVPKHGPGVKCKFLKSAIRKSIDFPLVNCAAAIETQNGIVRRARICLNSVYTLPYPVKKAEVYLEGKTVDEPTAETAASLIIDDAVPLLNNRYKVQIAMALIKRVIIACV